MYRPPNKRPKLMAKLRAVYDAWARGQHSKANLLLLQLPEQVQAAIALAQYLGKYGDLHARGYHRRLWRAHNIHVGRSYKLDDLTDEEHASIFRCPKPDVPAAVLAERPYATIKSLDYESGSIEFTMTAESEAAATSFKNPVLLDPPPDSAATFTPTIVDASCHMTLRASALFPDDRTNQPREETSVDWADVPFTWARAEGEP